MDFLLYANSMGISLTSRADVGIRPYGNTPHIRVGDGLIRSTKDCTK
ncbi:MAG: hypothetical protein IKB50_01310 [Clostridia bacterium]|nr:hypothetical protein [Clostridia bacterium]